MGKIKHFNIASTKLDKDRISQDIERAINGGISFGTPITGQIVKGLNIDGVFVVVADTGNANTSFTVIHNLGRIPVGFDTKRINVAGTVFDSGTAWTKTQMFLKCNVAHAAVTLFIH